jgi:hypothetical protein
MYEEYVDKALSVKLQIHSRTTYVQAASKNHSQGQEKDVKVYNTHTHFKKRLAIFPSPAGRARNNLIIPGQGVFG